ncbi:alpha/beta fold hydrolase [Burkholderia sp. 22PA0106]|uniref:alpha/beta fold hydrolase n=1 Tax=Burkholderia sp. 22PA0106 TaxID=3237371 RepID=UPI0039C3FFC9
MRDLPLVLLPGTLCDASLWQAQYAAFVDERPVIVPDLGIEASIGAEAARMLAELPERFWLAGFSLGGIVALELVRQARDRVAGLCLIGSNARPDRAENRPHRMTLLQRACDGELRAMLREALTPHYFATGSRQVAALTAQVETMAEAVRSRFAHQTRYACERSDSLPLLASLEVPVALIVGDDDRVVPPGCQQDMLAAAAHASLAVVPACGHFVPLEAPQACNDAMRRWMGG